MPTKLRSLLTIAASDPTGGAGIQADIRTGSLMGLHVMSAITAITVQNSLGFYSMNPVSPDILGSQLKAIYEDVLPDAIKIGMVGSIGNIKVIKEFISSIPNNIPIVIDPILKATMEIEKDKSELILKYKNDLFPYATLLTPNLDELKLLSPKTDLSNIKLILKDLNVKGMVVKSISETATEIEDVLIFKDKILINKHLKHKSKNLHGTGCVYSTLLASKLALSNSVEQAFFKSNLIMSEIILKSCSYSLGNSTYGPLNINDYRL